MAIRTQDGSIHFVYILGTTRSGTSALRHALAKTRYVGYGEGHIVKLLADMTSLVRREIVSSPAAAVPGNAISNFKEDQYIRQLFRAHEAYHSEALQGSYILDKTPNIFPIAHVLDLATYHSHPKFLYCRRRHIDNILSKQRKFGGVTLRSHCSEWVGCCEAWEKEKARLNGNFLEFDHDRLMNDRRGLCRDIGRYLGLAEAEVASMATYLETTTPESSAAGRSPGHGVKLSETSWSEDERAMFAEICGPLGEQLGYGFETYFAR